MSISDEAVEAAYAELPDDAPHYVNKARLRRVLAAAAPHIRVQAWAEGYQQGYEDRNAK